MPARSATFEEKLAKGIKLEPHDDIPDEYREAAIRMISFHGLSEVFGALPEGEWIPRAPTLWRKKVLTAKVQDEVGHGQMLLRVLEDLGADREALLDGLAEGTAKFLNIFHYEYETWADVGMIGWWVDGAELIRQATLKETSYAPYARAMERICYEETFHYVQGRDIIETMVNGTQKQFDMVQDAVNRWWEPMLMLFGPHDGDSTHTDVLVEFGLKSESNDTIRQKWLDKFVPQVRRFGLEIPDPTIHYDDRREEWVYQDPDWSEYGRLKEKEAFKRRLAYFQRQHENGRWIRDQFSNTGQRQAV